MYFLVHRNKWDFRQCSGLKTYRNQKFKSRCAGWGKEPFPAVLVIDETGGMVYGMCEMCLRFSRREKDMVQILESPLHWLPSPNNDQRSRRSPMWSESVPTGFGLCHLRGTLHGKTGMPGTSACPGLKNTASFSINCLCASDQPWAQTLWAMFYKALKKPMLALRTGRHALLGWRTAGR